jgi:hypothetical protein
MALSETIAILALIVSLASFLRSHNIEKRAKRLLFVQKKGELSFAISNAFLLLQENKNILCKIASIEGGFYKNNLNEYAVEANLPKFEDFIVIIDKAEKQYKNMLMGIINDKVKDKPEEIDKIESFKNKVLVFNQQMEKLLVGYKELMIKINKLSLTKGQSKT